MKPAILNEITGHAIELGVDGEDYLAHITLKCVDEGEDMDSQYPGSSPEWECIHASLYWCTEDGDSQIPDEAIEAKVLRLATEEAIDGRAYDVWHG